MSNYQDLYKKYRPRIWDDVIGQDLIVNEFKQSLKENRLATGYLLIGNAGTGKTTMAKILAKAVNCDHLDENMNPCNQCATCRGIDNDAQLGFRYISMANNGSVDDIRKLMEDSRLSAPIKKQVFILDEVQNCSRSAFDSMLIGLESEAQKTLFLFCTTDPNKIPEAIKSRLRIRNLNKVSNKDLGRLLIKIATNENVKDKLNKEKLAQAIMNADGSVRTAITNLETIIMDGELPAIYSIELIKSIVNGDLKAIFEITKKMEEESQDPVKTSEQIYKGLSIVLKAKLGLPLEDKRYEEIINQIEGNTIIKILNELLETFHYMSSRIVSPKILFENFLIKATNKQRLARKNK